jgi:hypothetical protein
MEEHKEKSCATTRVVNKTALEGIEERTSGLISEGCIVPLSSLDSEEFATIARYSDSQISEANYISTV